VTQLFVVEGHHLDGRSLEEHVKVVTSVVTFSALQDNRRFEYRHSRHQASVGLLNPRHELGPLGLVE
jgi:hypothetical protein